jgi:hypothetical protein
MSLELIAFFVLDFERAPSTHPVIATLDHPLFAFSGKREKKIE